MYSICNLSHEGKTPSSFSLHRNTHIYVNSSRGDPSYGLYTNTCSETNTEKEKPFLKYFGAHQGCDFKKDLHFIQLVSYMIRISSFAKLDSVSKNK